MCDDEDGARTQCRATAECQGGRGVGDGAVSHDWGRGVIAELITIVTGIDFCLPDLLRLLWELS